jgi:uncharacterized protein
MKLSKYIVKSKLNESEYLLFSTISSKKIIVNNLIYQSLECNEILNLPEETFEYLKNNFFIIDSKINELDLIIKHNKHVMDNSDSFYFGIMPTAKCQMGCGYCGQTHSETDLNKQDSDKIVEFVKNKVLSNVNFSNLIIGWYGGEPLSNIAFIDTFCTDVNRFCNSLNIKVGYQTPSNGLLLSVRNYEILHRLGFNVIEVTIDGTKEFHDKSRILKNGGKSFDKIISNLDKLIQNCPDKLSRTKIAIRINVSKTNFDNVHDLIDFFISKKYFDYFSYSIHPVHDFGHGENQMSEDKKKIANLEIEILHKMKKISTDLHLIPERRPEVCLAVNKYSFIIDPFGDLYSCTEIPIVDTYNKEDYKIGSIESFEQTKINEGFLRNWYDEILQGTSGSPCNNCNILPICGGQCPKNWKSGTNSCPLLKYNIEDKLKLLYEFSES